MSAATGTDQKPPAFNYVLSFILVGLAWGLTTPFIRRAARTHNPPAHPLLDSPAVKGSWLKSKLYGAIFGVFDLLRNPRYAVPLLLNLTGSVWFFLLIGQAGRSSSPCLPSFFRHLVNTPRVVSIQPPLTKSRIRPIRDLSPNICLSSASSSRSAALI